MFSSPFTTELFQEKSETKQDLSSSSPGVYNPVYEMDSVVIKNFGTAAEDGNFSEEQKKPLDVEQGQEEEEEVTKIDLSKQEDQSFDMKEDDEQHQRIPYSVDDDSKSGQFFKDDDCESNHSSSGDHSIADHASESDDFNGDYTLIDADDVDPEKISKTSHDEKESCDDDDLSSEKQSTSLPDEGKAEENEEEHML